MSTSATAATINFLLPPLAGWASVLIVPPKVNVGAGAEASFEEALLGSIALLIGADSLYVDSLLSVNPAVVDSRAGAGALAELIPNPVRLEVVATLDSILAEGISGKGSRAANAAALSEMISSGTLSSCSRLVLTRSMELAVPPADVSIEALGAAAAIGGCETAGGVSSTCEIAASCGGADTVAGGLEVEVADAGFVPSLLRNSPRATLKVPFACSTLMGLVRTKFAPIRKAFATPACPSTTATASADWLCAVLRALLNNNVAFCSLSQSTTTASKCSAISFLTAANGSVQGVTLKSSSLSTWVTGRAVFSSGQKRRA